MKKFLLMVVSVLITLSASAITRQHAPKAKFDPKDSKTLMATPGAFKSFAAKQEAMNAFYSGVTPTASKVSHIKASRRAEGEETVEPQLIPGCSLWTYFYHSIVGGFIPRCMYTGASYLVADGKAYFAPFANLGYVEGVVEKDVNNQYIESGADSITFTASVIATYTDPDTKAETKLSLEPCYIENYTPYRSETKTFGAYYFKEYNELYIPATVTVALFDANSTDINIFDEYYVARRLDLEPQEDMKSYFSKGTFSGKSYYGAEYDLEGECEVYLGSQYAIYVKGADGANDGAWVEYSYDEKDDTRLVVGENQLVGVFDFYNDDTRTDTHPGIVTTVGLLQSGGQLTGFNSENNYASYYKISDNADETTTIASAENTVYGDYVFEDAAYGKGGMYNAIDQNIVITYEPVYETAIKGIVGDSNRQNGQVYNLKGQRVNADFKGLVIKNGKKMIQK